MKKVQNQKQYSSVMKMLYSTDNSSSNSLMYSVLINKLVNFLFLKLDDAGKDRLIEILKSGINIDFMEFASENISENEYRTIADSIKSEMDHVYSNLLISHSNNAN